MAKRKVKAAKKPKEVSKTQGARKRATKSAKKAKKSVAKAAKKKTVSKKTSVDPVYGEFSFEILMDAKKLIDKMGGIEKAKEAITVIEQLSD